MLRYEFTKFAKTDELICMNESMNNHGNDEHSHDFIEITYINKGKGIYTENGVSSNIMCGDIIMLSSNDIHSFTPLCNDFAWINCLFIPQLLAPSLSQSCSIQEIFNLDLFAEKDTYNFSGMKNIHLRNRANEFQNLFKDMVYEYYNAKIGYNKIMRYQLITLITKIIRTYIETANNKTDFTEDELTNIVRSFFNSSSSYSKISLDSIAKKAFDTPKYFSALFKKKVGINLSDYIKNIRLDHASDMLLRTNSNINDIMRYVGYQDSKYFYTSFKKKFNVTPGVYRKLYQKEKNQ